MNKKVSIIIPCYNQGKYVADAINSALSQTYKNIEIVVYNDASNDNSSEIIKTFVNKNKNIIFIDNTLNHGVIYARNTAIDTSQGEYILPLDADDTIEPTYVEKAVKVLDENPEIGIVYCKARKFGVKKKYWNLQKFDKSKFIYKNCIFCTALFRKSDFIKAGKYKEYMLYGYEDYDLWLSFIELGMGVYRIDEILFNYRQHLEESRTTVCRRNQDKVWKCIIKNHFDLYIEDKQFLDILIFTKKYKDFLKIIIITLSTIVFIQLIIIGWLLCFQ